MPQGLLNTNDTASPGKVITNECDLSLLFLFPVWT